MTVAQDVRTQFRDATVPCHDARVLTGGGQEAEIASTGSATCSGSPVTAS